VRKISQRRLTEIKIADIELKSKKNKTNQNLSIKIDSIQKKLMMIAFNERNKYILKSNRQL
jgi:hypothetical protein